MNKRYFVFILPILFSLLFTSWGMGQESKKGDIRASILAGTWYPGDKDTLSRAIGDYLSRVKHRTLEGELAAVIVPHAGYIYSGQVAAHAYRLLQKMDFKRVVMIGPSHRVAFRGVSVNLQTGYETPLGIVPVDRVFARELIRSSDQIRWLPRAHAREHSLEIEVPFLQTVLTGLRIIPIVMGQQDFKTCSNLAEKLIRVMENKEKTLILASTDLSHFHTYERARELDQVFIKYIREFDPEGLARSLAAGKCEACGGGPAVTAMLAAGVSGANRAIILNYANSGDVTGDKRKVVGYLAAALIRGK